MCCTKWCFGFSAVLILLLGVYASWFFGFPPDEHEPKIFLAKNGIDVPHPDLGMHTFDETTSTEVSCNMLPSAVFAPRGMKEADEPGFTWDESYRCEVYVTPDEATCMRVSHGTSRLSNCLVPYGLGTYVTCARIDPGDKLMLFYEDDDLLALQELRSEDGYPMWCKSIQSGTFGDQLLRVAMKIGVHGLVYV